MKGSLADRVAKRNEEFAKANRPLKDMSPADQASVFRETSAIVWDQQQPVPRREIAAMRMLTAYGLITEKKPAHFPPSARSLTLGRAARVLVGHIDRLYFDETRSPLEPGEAHLGARLRDHKVRAERLKPVWAIYAWAIKTKGGTL